MWAGGSSTFGPRTARDFVKLQTFDRLRHFSAVRAPETHGKDWFGRHCLTEAANFDKLCGKTVALVGNARALMQTSQGQSIDAHDIVIRINNAPGLGTDAAGYKLDWLATAVLPRRLAVDRVLWIGRKVRKIPFELMTSGRLYVHQAACRNDLSEGLGARASTGIMTADLLLRSPAATITLYGFDFYASRSLSGPHTIDNTPHNYQAEKDWITARTAQDSRLQIVPTRVDTTDAG